MLVGFLMMMLSVVVFVGVSGTATSTVTKVCALCACQCSAVCSSLLQVGFSHSRLHWFEDMSDFYRVVCTAGYLCVASAASIRALHFGCVSTGSHRTGTAAKLSNAVATAVCFGVDVLMCALCRACPHKH